MNTNFLPHNGRIFEDLRGSMMSSKQYCVAALELGSMFQFHRDNMLSVHVYQIITFDHNSDV